MPRNRNDALKDIDVFKGFVMPGEWPYRWFGNRLENMECRKSRLEGMGLAARMRGWRRRNPEKSAAWTRRG